MHHLLGGIFGGHQADLRALHQIYAADATGPGLPNEEIVTKIPRIPLPTPRTLPTVHP